MLLFLFHGPPERVRIGKDSPRIGGASTSWDKSTLARAAETPRGPLFAQFLEARSFRAVFRGFFAAAKPPEPPPMTTKSYSLPCSKGDWGDSVPLSSTILSSDASSSDDTTFRRRALETIPGRSTVVVSRDLPRPSSRPMMLGDERRHRRRL